MVHTVRRNLLAYFAAYFGPKTVLLAIALIVLLPPSYATGDSSKRWSDWHLHLGVANAQDLNCHYYSRYNC
jgi:hypothetical protein